MLTVKEVAKQLDGSRSLYDSRFDWSEIADAGIVVLHGVSDDLAEFEGAIHGEYGCISGWPFYLNGDGEILDTECPDSKRLSSSGNRDASDWYVNFCPHFKEAVEGTARIEPVWSDEYPLWSYKTDIPHETFDIPGKNGVYCRGIVFCLDDLKPLEENAGDIILDIIEKLKVLRRVVMKEE
jgi:hypothetical protein